jgi:hypothetical protein
MKLYTPHWQWGRPWKCCIPLSKYVCDVIYIILLSNLTLLFYLSELKNIHGDLHSFTVLSLTLFLPWDLNSLNHRFFHYEGRELRKGETVLPLNSPFLWWRGVSSAELLYFLCLESSHLAFQDFRTMTQDPCSQEFLSWLTDRFLQKYLSSIYVWNFGQPFWQTNHILSCALVRKGFPFIFHCAIHLKTY